MSDLAVNPPTPPEIWTSKVSGGWSIARNWSLGRAPLSNDNVEIEPDAPLTVTYTYTGTLVIAELTLIGATLNFAANTHLQVSAQVTLQNAKIDTYPGRSGASFILSYATVDGLTVGGDLSLDCTKGRIVESGAGVTIGDAGSSQANIVNEDGSIWYINNDSISGKNATNHFYNYGFMQFEGDCSIQASFQSIAGDMYVDPNGTLAIDGLNNIISGSIEGAGLIQYGAHSTTTLGRSVPSTLLALCDETNLGAVTMVSSINLTNGVNILNAAGAHWTISGDFSIISFQGTSIGTAFTNQGQFSYVGSGKAGATAHVKINADMAGSIDIEGGALSFEGPTSVFSGLVTGAGTLELKSQTTTIDSGAALRVANWDLASGVTNLDESLSYAGAFSQEGASSMFLGGHFLTLSGPVDFAGGAVAGSGFLDVNGPTTVTGLTIGGTARVAIGGAATQATAASLVVADSSQLAIVAGGSLSLTTDDFVVSEGNGGLPAPTISIAAGAGGILKTGSGTAYVEPTLYNWADGGLAAQSGVLDVEGAVYGTGSSVISGSATLEFSGSVAGGQRLVFDGSDATLELSDATQAKIFGFDRAGVDDAIVLAGGSLSLRTTRQSTTESVLVFSLGSGFSGYESLTLVGDYSHDTFSAQTVSGGLKITIG